ncbi:Uncharacterised protein [Streptococcus pneumoniae]|nr:Uncharacterised protein [Streptococcus pneumoniae]VOP48825.1 Uncharacterised protein [Streptococcus pneumoniae]VQT91437.1 Uncharacterised protein [Streptococcus pneumoniae]
MNVKKIMSIFQSFYVDVSIEELTLTLPISFVKRFEYTQMTFHKESFLLIKEKRRGSLSSFVTQARTMGEKANMDVVLVFSKLSDSEKKQIWMLFWCFRSYQTVKKSNYFKLEFRL